MSEIIIDELSPEQQDELLRQLQAKKDGQRLAQRTAYEGLRREFCSAVHNRVDMQSGSVKLFHQWLIGEVEAFRQVMAEYGALATAQKGFTLVGGDFKMEVKANKVKRFDERADIAATRLIAFLKSWVKGKDKGTDDPMYQLAMLAIERNAKGDLDYKQVSNLYQLEGNFNDPEYSAIMELFRESNIIDGVAVNFYFYQRDEMGVWHKIEISFNRL